MYDRGFREENATISKNILGKLWPITLFFVKLWLRRSNFQPLVNELQFSCLGLSNQWYKDTIFCRNSIARSLREDEMHPVALHTSSTRTIDWSQALERWFLQKQISLYSQQKDKLLGQKVNQSFVTSFFLTVVVEQNSIWVFNIFLISHLAYTFNYSTMKLGRKIEVFRSLNVVETGTTIDKKKFYLQMLQYSVTKQLCFVLCTVKCGLVSEWVFWAMPHFFICFCKTLNFEQPWSSKFSTSVSIERTRILQFSVLFAKFSPFTALGRMLCELIVLQTTTVWHNSVQVSCTAQRSLWSCNSNIIECQFRFELED